MPTGTKAEKAAKRRTVAAGAIAGKTPKAIAKAAGCSKRHVQRLAAEPETQFLIADALRPYRAKLSLMARKALLAVDKALGANHKDKADHIARLRAVERYGELMEMAQGTDKPASPEGGLVTWEEFTVLYRSRRETHEPESRADQQ